MSTNGRLDERLDGSITSWLEHAAPPRLPERVLAATFERTRGSRQQVGWRARLGRFHAARSALALGGAAALVVAAALSLNVATVPGIGGPPATADPRGSYLGTWLSTSDADGGIQTMTIQAAGDGTVEIVVTDSIASVCSRAPSTMTGTGRLEGDAKLIMPSPMYACDDGSEPRALSGQPLQEQLRNLTFVRDAQAGTLTDNFGSVWLLKGATPPSPEPSITSVRPSSEAEVTALLDGFLDARVAGAGAERYLSSVADVPLLYATTSGAPYERAEFEPVAGIQWPYGWTAFKVRLFDPDTVVEQLVFIGRDGPPWLEYQSDGFGTDIAPTTENGQPVAVPYTVLDGHVTLEAAHPWVMWPGRSSGWLIPEGPAVRPTTDGGERRDWDRLVLIADPAVGVTGCPVRGAMGAHVLDESIRSIPDLQATAPTAASVGGADALMMDVSVAKGTTISVPVDEGQNFCGDEVLNLLLDMDATTTFHDGVATGPATGARMRLYLVDAPEGSAMQTLAIAIVAPEASFERAVEAAAPILHSIKFQAP
jgi:hypothetical protein